MKKILAGLLLMLPVSALADSIDVIEFKLKEGCDMPQYMAIVADFNAWGATVGYKAGIMVPIHRANLETMFWLGRASNAEAFGNAWDVWRDAQKDASSVPARLAARFAACAENLNRSLYDTYK